MSYPQLEQKQIAQRGMALYAQRIRSQVESPENIGKLIAINIETEEYQIGDDLIDLAAKLRSTQPDAMLWAERVGYDAVYAVGGTRIRTKQ